MRHALVYLILATLALAGSAAAQDPGGYGAGGGTGMRGGHRGGMRGGMGGPAAMARLDPVVVQGPPAPADFARIVDLPEDHVARYAQLYDRFMTTTRPQRDSLDALRQSMREAFENGDREAAGKQRTLIEPLTKDLEHRLAAFDDTLHGAVDKSQWDKYQNWRSDQRKQAEKDRQDRGRNRQGGQAPPT
jgi:hypothetical protein